MSKGDAVGTAGEPSSEDVVLLLLLRACNAACLRPWLCLLPSSATLRALVMAGEQRSIVGHENRLPGLALCVWHKDLSGPPGCRACLHPPRWKVLSKTFA